MPTATASERLNWCCLQGVAGRTRGGACSPVVGAQTLRPACTCLVLRLPSAIRCLTPAQPTSRRSLTSRCAPHVRTQSMEEETGSLKQILQGMANSVKADDDALADFREVGGARRPPSRRLRCLPACPQLTYLLNVLR